MAPILRHSLKGQHMSYTQYNITINTPVMPFNKAPLHEVLQIIIDNTGCKIKFSVITDVRFVEPTFTELINNTVIVFSDVKGHPNVQTIYSSQTPSVYTTMRNISTTYEYSKKSLQGSLTDLPKEVSNKEDFLDSWKQYMIRNAELKQGIFQECEIEIEESENRWNNMSWQYFKHNIFDRIRKELEIRYTMFDPIPQLSGKIIDTYLPSIFSKYNFNVYYIKQYLKSYKNISMIHRGFANMLSVRSVPIDELLKLIGYTPDRVKNLLKEVKKLQKDILFVGAGGVGTNTIYWLYEMCWRFDVRNIFKRVVVIDQDKLELHNLFRMPTTFRNYSGESRYSSSNTPITLERDIESNAIFGGSECTSNRLYSVKKILALDPLWLNTLSTKKYRVESETINAESNFPYSIWIRSLFRANPTNTHIIAYGAPTIETRDIITKHQAIHNFICATHSGNHCNIVVNPEYVDADRGIMAEGYGVIQLNVFFLNQIRLALGFLETLIDIQDTKSPKDTIKLDKYMPPQKTLKLNSLAYTDISTIR